MLVLNLTKTPTTRIQFSFLRKFYTSANINIQIWEEMFHFYKFEHFTFSPNLQEKTKYISSVNLQLIIIIIIDVDEISGSFSGKIYFCCYLKNFILEDVGGEILQWLPPSVRCYPPPPEFSHGESHQIADLAQLLWVVIAVITSPHSLSLCMRLAQFVLLSVLLFPRPSLSTDHG